MNGLHEGVLRNFPSNVVFETDFSHFARNVVAAAQGTIQEGCS
jgi:hypothetical protein